MITKYQNLEDAENAKNFIAEKDLKFSVGSESAYFTTVVDAFANGNDVEAVTDYYLSRMLAPRRGSIKTSPVAGRCFLKTGDVASLDSDGFIKFTGRSKELINRGGEKISPIEIDNVFLKMADVIKEAGCFGAPHDVLGQVVHLCIVLQDGVQQSSQLLDELKKRAQQKLAPFKVRSAHTQFTCNNHTFYSAGEVQTCALCRSPRKYTS